MYNSTDGSPTHGHGEVIIVKRPSLKRTPDVSALSLTLNVRGPSYHGLTRSISLRRQNISSHDIDYVEYVGSCLTWGRILSTCVISMWSNDIKCKYMFMFPLKKLARKGLTWLNHYFIMMPGSGLGVCFLGGDHIQHVFMCHHQITHLFEFAGMYCMLSTFRVSPWIEANISESSLL